MALVNEIVLEQLEDFLLSLQDNPTDETKQKIRTYASGFTDFLVTTIKSATIVVAAGIPVATAGTALAQTGVTTAPATASIN